MKIEFELDKCGNLTTRQTRWRDGGPPVLIFFGGQSKSKSNALGDKAQVTYASLDPSSFCLDAQGIVHVSSCDAPTSEEELHNFAIISFV